MFKETLQQSASDGRSFVQCLMKQGVLPGIKVDEVSCWLNAGAITLGAENQVNVVPGAAREAAVKRGVAWVVHLHGSARCQEQIQYHLSIGFLGQLPREQGLLGPLPCRSGLPCLCTTRGWQHSLPAASETTQAHPLQGLELLEGTGGETVTKGLDTLEERCKTYFRWVCLLRHAVSCLIGGRIKALPGQGAAMYYVQLVLAHPVDCNACLHSLVLRRASSLFLLFPVPPDLAGSRLIRPLPADRVPSLPSGARL